MLGILAAANGLVDRAARRHEGDPLVDQHLLGGQVDAVQPVAGVSAEPDTADPGDGDVGVRREDVAEFKHLQHRGMGDARSRAGAQDSPLVRGEPVRRCGDQTLDGVCLGFQEAAGEVATDGADGYACGSGLRPGEQPVLIGGDDDERQGVLHTPSIPPMSHFAPRFPLSMMLCK